eukprot:Pgem_evm1s1050
MYCAKVLTFVAAYAWLSMAMPNDKPTAESGNSTDNIEEKLRENCQVELKKAEQNSCDVYKEKAKNCLFNETFINQTSYQTIAKIFKDSGILKLDTATLWDGYQR